MSSNNIMFSYYHNSYLFLLALCARRDDLDSVSLPDSCLCLLPLPVPVPSAAPQPKETPLASLSLPSSELLLLLWSLVLAERLTPTTEELLRGFLKNNQCKKRPIRKKYQSMGECYIICTAWMSKFGRIKQERKLVVRYGWRESSLFLFLPLSFFLLTCHV